MTAEEANATVKSFMLDLATHLKPEFPYHAAALADEIQGRKMTSDRWHRIAAVLASLHAVPGVALGPTEHAKRNPALAAVPIATKMAAALFNSRDPEWDFDFAIRRSGEIADEFPDGDA